MLSLGVQMATGHEQAADEPDGHGGDPERPAAPPATVATLADVDALVTDLLALADELIAARAPASLTADFEAVVADVFDLIASLEQDRHWPSDVVDPRDATR